ncbi:MAG: DUF2442 domain-containing protein [Anaerolineae bacterium]
MTQLVEVRALDGYRLWLRYADGVEGVVDLSDHVGKGVFAAWEDPRVSWGLSSNEPPSIRTSFSTCRSGPATMSRCTQ